MCIYCTVEKRQEKREGWIHAARNESVTIVASDRAPVIPGDEKTLEINRGSIRIPCNVEKLTNY